MTGSVQRACGQPRAFQRTDKSTGHANCPCGRWPVVGSSRCLRLASAPRPWERLPLQVLQALQALSLSAFCAITSALQCHAQLISQCRSLTAALHERRLGSFTSLAPDLPPRAPARCIRKHVARPAPRAPRPAPRAPPPAPRPPPPTPRLPTAHRPARTRP
jgi:hypothetical protein